MDQTEFRFYKLSFLLPGLLTLLAIILIGFVFLLVPGVVGLIGLIEGILYLTKSDADFQREYLIGKKPWF